MDDPAMNNKFARARVPSSSKRNNNNNIHYNNHNNNNIHYNNHNNNKQETKFLVLFAFDDYFMEFKKKKLHSLLKKKLFIESVLFVFIIACNDFFFPFISFNK